MLARLARSQAINVRNAARGWPLTYQGATAMTLDDDDLALAARLLEDRAGWSEAAPVEAFEREFAQWNASRSAFAFVSGRVALRAAIDSLGLVPDDEVVVPGYTCVVVTNALRAAGLRPVFADIELDTYGLDRDALRRALTGRTKAVLIQHLYGYVTRDLDDLLTISRAHGLAVIEDCAQAAGAEHRGGKVGNFGDVAIFSGDPSKPFTCIQGGVAVAGDEQIAARLAEIRRAAPLQSNDDIANRLRNVPLNYTLSKDRQRWWKGDLAWLRHGDDYFFGIPASEVAGAPPADLGCRMSAPIAMLASNQLRKLDHYNARRRANAGRWDAWCDAAGFTKPTVLAGSTPIVLRYPVIVTPEMKRDLRWAYRALGVVPGTWFVTHLHPAPGRLDGVPNATCAVDRCINFPTLYFEDRWGATRRAG
jgi:dTDP-4-amino-4,6-dideoxygalactose transaminase